MGQAARKITANDKLTHKLAEALGSVAEACRRGGIDRTSFFDWKRRFQLGGLHGLKDLPPTAKRHPMITPPEVVGRIAALAVLHPAYGCNGLEALLALEGHRLSAITIQKILDDQGVGTRHERGLALERRNRAGDRAQSRAGRRSWKSSLPDSGSTTSRARGLVSWFPRTPSWSAP